MRNTHCCTVGVTAVCARYLCVRQGELHEARRRLAEQAGGTCDTVQLRVASTQAPESGVEVREVQ